MKKPLATLAAAAIAGGGVLAVPVLGATPTKTVKVLDFKFTPRTITVAKGTKVTWKWGGATVHNVTVTKGPVKFHSATFTKGSFSKTLTRPGTYSIVCTIHAPAMAMTLKVTK